MQQKLTEPENEKGNHSTGGDADMFGNVVGKSVNRWPNSLQHDVHAGRADHGVDTSH